MDAASLGPLQIEILGVHHSMAADGKVIASPQEIIPFLRSAGAPAAARRGIPATQMLKGLLPVTQIGQGIDQLITGADSAQRNQPS